MGGVRQSLKLANARKRPIPERRCDLKGGSSYGGQELFLSYE